jgi:hypothetical protein
MTKIRAQIDLGVIGEDVHMKEIRLTLNADDFGAISQVLVDMGVGFRVEPLEDAGTEAAPARPNTGSTPPRRQAAKKRGKASPKQPEARGETPLSAADRLRKAIARKQSAGPALSSSAGQPTAENAAQTYRSTLTDDNNT